MRKRPLPKFPERDRHWPGKKDTKRWCRGVVGREHKLNWVPHPGVNPKFGAKVLLCKACGKHMEYFWPNHKWKWL